jgi:hypothetical protein
MDTTVTTLPVKPAQRQPVCGACWDPINWCESFYKFGHGEGDECVHTGSVAHVLRAAGYHAETFDETMHNTVISQVGYRMSDGTINVVYTDDLPAGNQVGYSDPREMLPADIVKFLDDSFGRGEFFG